MRYVFLNDAASRAVRTRNIGMRSRAQIRMLAERTFDLEETEFEYTEAAHRGMQTRDTAPKGCDRVAMLSQSRAREKKAAQVLDAHMIKLGIRKLPWQELVASVVVSYAMMGLGLSYWAMDRTNK